jgi:nicotinamidase-related amidase
LASFDAKLNAALHSLGADTVVVLGGETDACVLATVLAQSIAAIG